MSELRHNKIKSALVSVFDKSGLQQIVEELHRLDIEIITTGGTESFIKSLGIPVTPVESLTGFPSILDGRVKTLHPAIFGGILAIREKEHLLQLGEYNLAEIDLVVVDLYPFQDTVSATDDEYTIIEKIDIGGISLIRAAAKNYRDVVIIPSKNQYSRLFEILNQQEGVTSLDERKYLATQAFGVTSIYDTAIHEYFNGKSAFNVHIGPATPLRYGENPHQKANYYGDLDQIFTRHAGKELSYNNLMDIEAAMQLIQEFINDDPTFVIIKHTNSCGVATRSKLFEAWNAALSCDSISAFGGILVCNKPMDVATALEIDKLFYEVLLVPEFEEAALNILKQKKNRILLSYKNFTPQTKMFRNILNGVIEHDADLHQHDTETWKKVTSPDVSPEAMKDLIFANKCVKHLKSNTIALVKNKTLVGMGCGQTSRVDALKQAILKAKTFGFELAGAAMASDAFFPFPDCVEIASKVGVKYVVHPGGSIKDQDSINYCEHNDMSMYLTGIRHFKH